MTFLNMLDALLIGPLKTLFEVIFSYAYTMLQNPGWAVVVLSLCMNILVLPLYKRADAIQIEARDTENKLRDTVAHIKKTFSGDERMMILQTYYSQNGYNPLSVLSGSISLMLEIPFFMAAYQFLSHVGAFSGASFGPIADLSVPDGLIVVGNVTINALPFLMTFINVLSSSLYLKGFPLKTKIQLYGMALFFLIFLYNSPAALVFYWTLNNTFSLVKTLFARMKHAKKVLNILLGTAGAAFLALGLSNKPSGILIALGIAMELAWALPLIKKKLPTFRTAQKELPKPNTKQFLAGALLLTVLVGLLIPSTFIAASPQEYIDTSYFYHPGWYIANTMCLAAGTFLIWFSVFYWLANPGAKVIFSRLVWVLSGVLLVNYMFFGTNLGILSPDLAYADGFGFARAELLINLLVVIVAAVALYLLAVRFSRTITTILLIGAIALSCMGVINLNRINNAAEETYEQITTSPEQLPSIALSKTGKNVVVIMLDRGMNPFVPYIFEECPELKESFDGFTCYSNTLSYGAFTNFATPSLFGGYEYMPAEMNKRASESLQDKHNEALKVVPKLLSEEGYQVTLIDPSYAGYTWIPDLSIYDDLPGVNAYLADGKFNDFESRIKRVEARQRNFFLFSIMKTIPLFMQKSIYNEGQYHRVLSKVTSTDTSAVMPNFMNAYHVLNNLENITQITTENQNTYTFWRSNITHEPVILQEPNYEPASVVDNSKYYPAEGKTITAGEKSFLLQKPVQISHYHTNVLAMKKLGEWFDHLKKINAYDNTRIIIVSDHGRGLEIIDQDENALHDIDFYQAMLLVKDFDSHGFTSSHELMTIADVPTISLTGLVENMINPYTGNEINSQYKETNDNHYVIVSQAWNTTTNCGNQFFPSEWAVVSGDVTKKDNWVFFGNKDVFPPDYEK